MLDVALGCSDFWCEPWWFPECVADVGYGTGRVKSVLEDVGEAECGRVQVVRGCKWLVGEVGQNFVVLECFNEQGPICFAWEAQLFRFGSVRRCDLVVDVSVIGVGELCADVPVLNQV